MSATRLLTIVAASAILASGAELKGTWAASSTGGQRLAGAWTAQAHPESGGVTGTWSLFDAGGKILREGRLVREQVAEILGRRVASHRNGPNRRILGNVDSRNAALPRSPAGGHVESALRAVVTGTWESGANSGSWSIKAYP